MDLRHACVTGAGQGMVAAELIERRLRERGLRPAPDCATRILFADDRRAIRLLPRAFRQGWRASGPIAHEGFVLRRLGKGRTQALVVAAGSTRGFVYGAGWILRKASAGNDAIRIDVPRIHREAPMLAVRGNQIGYRFKNNSYDAWTLAMLVRRIEDFALLGANRIQMIAPISDDARHSPLEPQPPIDTLIGMARATHRLGIDVALFYPLLRDYDGPEAVAAEMRDFTGLLEAVPWVDAVYVPGGDPGHTGPERLFPLLARLSTGLRTRFPKAELLVSTQGFDAVALDRFHAGLAARPRWLTAIFVGPQTRDTLAAHRRRIAGRYPVELYPDTAHAMHAQYPVPEWHPAFALTEGREPVNPRPAQMARIFADQARGTRGFVTYSEGVNDDWNITQWFRLGWNPRTPISEVAADYARMFVGDPAFAGIPARLEANWRGDPANNPAIMATLTAVDRVRPAGWADWRIDLYRYRAVYDALVRVRLGAARAREADALRMLRAVGGSGAEIAVAAARAAYARPDPADATALRARLDALAERLWHNARMQLSVARYGASGWERGANLDRAGIDLNDRVAIARAMAAALALPDPQARRAALLALGDRALRREGARYDDLGDPAHEPHLVRGAGFARDPQLRATAIDGVADHIPDEGWRMAELSYAEALYDAPVRLRYTGLARDRVYRLRATWAGEDYAVPMALRANGVLLRPYQARASNPMTMEVDVPAALTATGSLLIEWVPPPGRGGGGRGHQIAEAWLLPREMPDTAVARHGEKHRD